MKKFLIIGILFCLLCTMLMPTKVSAEKYVYTWTEVDEEGNEHTYTIEYDAEDMLSKNEVWVKIHPDWYDHEYTPEDFSEVNCIAIEELLLGAPDYDERYFLLTLSDEGLEKVYHAIEILGAREDITEAFANTLVVPPTGETTMLPAAVAMLVFSAVALAALAIRRKKA